mgnify:CR=1 FL=1
MYRTVGQTPTSSVTPLPTHSSQQPRPLPRAKSGELSLGNSVRIPPPLFGDFLTRRTSLSIDS